MSLDGGVKELSDVIGKIGLHQALTLLCSCYMTTVLGFSAVFVQILAPKVHLSWKNDVCNGTEMHWESTDCKRHEIDIFKPTINSSLSYYSKYSHNTLTEKFDLVCERSWLISLNSAIGMMGGILSSFLGGHFSENYGRKSTMYFWSILYIGSNFLILFAENMVMFAIGCFISGGASNVLSFTAFITISELISNKYRSVIGTLSQFSLIIGQLIAISCSWKYEDWFYVQLSHTIISILTLPATCIVLESPIWLMVKGKEKEAIHCVKAVIRRNGNYKDQDDNKIQQWIAGIKNCSSIAESTTEGKFLDLVKTPTIRKYFLSVAFVPSSIIFAYYGLIMNTETFGTNLYVDYMISSGLACLSLIICLISLVYLSARIFTMLFLSGLVITCTIYPIALEYSMARSVISTMARLFVTGPFATCYIVTIEVLPTSVRGIGYGSMRALSRIAAAISPFTKELGNKTSTYVPMLLFAALNLISILLLWVIIPETKGKPLVNTVKDLENKRKKNVDNDDQT